LKKVRNFAITLKIIKLASYLELIQIKIILHSGVNIFPFFVLREKDT